MPIYVGGFYLCLPLLVAASLLWGGKSERTVACMYAAASVATVMARHAWSVRYTEVETGVLVVDLLLLCGLLWMAARTRLWWLILSAAFHVLATLAHFGKIIDQRLLTNGYSLMVGLSSWPALTLLAIGIIEHRYRTRPSASNISGRS